MSDFCLMFFKALIHLNLNLAVLVLGAWVLLGRGKGVKTSMFVWSVLLGRFLLEPVLVRFAVPTSIDFGAPGMLSVGIGLSDSGETILAKLTQGEARLSVSDLLVYFWGRRLCEMLGAFLLTLLTLCLVYRLSTLLAAPGRGGVEWREGAFTPHLYGWLRPTVVLPTALGALTSGERNAVVAHERAHVRLGDHRLFACLYILRGFCPFVWPLATVLNGLEQALERRCDQYTAREAGAVNLARALVKVAGWSPPPAVLGPAFNGNSVGERLRSLRPGGLPESDSVKLVAVLFLGAVIL